MTEATQDRRSPFLALKVPFDLSGVALGALAWVVLTVAARHGYGFAAAGMPDGWREAGQAIDRALGRAVVAPDVGVSGMAAMDKWLDLAFRSDPLRPLADGRTLVPLLVLLGVFAVIGVAACRVAALRLARDEGLPTTEALAFSLRNIGASAGAVLFAAAAVGLFLGLNALAGLAGRVPLLGAVTYPLALVGALILHLLLLGTVFGLPLAFAGLATERNGALDAVSRSFSYVFGRPALFLVCAATVAFFAAVLAWVSAFLPRLAVETVAAGAASGDGALRAFRTAVEAAVAFRMPAFDGAGADAITGWVAWACASVLRLATAGWATYYVFGGATATYFALRRDVDGTEDEEIWIEGEDEGLGDPETPEPPGGGGAPSSAPASAPGASPPATT